MIDYAKTGLRILENLHAVCQASPLILVGDGVIGYQYCLSATNDEHSLADHELKAEMNDMLAVLFDKNVLEMDDFISFAEENVVMSYHDFTASGGKW